MVGGVLVERTVTEVLPALINNKEQVGDGVGKIAVVSIDYYYYFYLLIYLFILFSSWSVALLDEVNIMSVR